MMDERVPWGDIYRAFQTGWRNGVAWGSILVMCQVRLEQGEKTDVRQEEQESSAGEMTAGSSEERSWDGT